ncbi:sensor histidine kinase [Pontibacter rugosus]|uniref:histidine kinase n=1 Tax=Pontibacter rugosus TaxID=1745966 RepID=A0ABW3SSK1_9BACT
MSFKHYKLQLLLRVLLLSATVFLMAKLGLSQEYRLTLAGLGVLFLLQLWLLMRYMERTNSLYLRFLNSIRYDDFTEQFSVPDEGKTTGEIALRLNEVMEKFRQVRADKEAHLHYFEVIVQHIGIGIITFKPDGSVILINNAAKKLLNVRQLQQVQELASLSSELTQNLQQLTQGDTVLVPLQQAGEQINISLNIIELTLLGNRIRLASLQNIQRELEEKEMDAWSNLVKVLTHEIINSVTPISSLSASAFEEVHSYTDTASEEITLLREELLDVGQCLQTISRRSEGLIRFVNDFRNLSAIPVPQLSYFNVTELLQEIKILLREQLAQKQVELEVQAPQESMLLNADRSMIEQVLINLVKNAMEAVQEQPEAKVCLKASLDERSRIAIAVSDNGPGMTKEAVTKIFIPFFSTKPSGSGIGLSLSRQMMHLHKGTLAVQSQLGQGTTFILRF